MARDIATRDLDMNGFQIVNFKDAPSCAAEPLTVELRSPGLQSVSLRVNTTFEELFQDRIDFAQFKTHAIGVSLDADVMHTPDGGAETGELFLEVSNSGDDDKPTYSFFANLTARGSGWSQQHGGTPTIPKPTGKALVRLYGSGSGSFRNKVITLFEVPEEVTTPTTPTTPGSTSTPTTPAAPVTGGTPSVVSASPRS